MRKKLTGKLKQEIHDKPYSFKKSELSGDALAYLNRIRGARKAQKTKKEHKKYEAKKAGKKKAEKALDSVDDIIEIMAKEKGMSVKKFEKKFAKDVAEFRAKQKLIFEREVDMIKLDIKFLPHGRGVYNMNRKMKRVKILYLLTRLKNTILSTGLTYPPVICEVEIHGDRSYRLQIPTPDELKEVHDNGGDEGMLNYIQDNYPIKFFRR